VGYPNSWTLLALRSFANRHPSSGAGVAPPAPGNNWRKPWPSNHCQVARWLNGEYVEAGCWLAWGLPPLRSWLLELLKH
jgi:hypothetical protein